MTTVLESMTKISQFSLSLQRETGLTFLTSLGILDSIRGPLAQFGRAPQWHCGGHRFDPGTVHLMFSVYVIRSLSTGKFYVGHTGDVERRLKEHNNGLSHYTRHERPWELVWSEECQSSSEAMRREQEIKSRKSRSYIIKLVDEKRLGERPVTRDL
jgi:putative endonuclease